MFVGRVWVAVVLPAAILAVGVVLVAATDLEAGALVVSLLFAVPMVLSWWNCTVVSNDGVRLRRWLRWRTLPWSALAEVAEPGRAPRGAVVGVVTAEGEPVALDVPGALHAEFVEYALAHGLPQRSRGR